MKIFRSFFFDHNSNIWIGRSTIKMPSFFKIFSISIFVITSSLITFMFLGSYEKIESYKGIIKPQSGFESIFAPTSNAVKQIHVSVGDDIIKGTLIAELQSKIPEDRLKGFIRRESEIRELYSLSKDEKVVSKYESKESDRKHTRIESELDGYIYKIGYNINDIINSNTPLYISAPVNGNLIIDIDVTPDIYSKIEKGKIVKLKLNDFIHKPQLIGEIDHIGVSPKVTRNKITNEIMYTYDVRILLDEKNFDIKHKKLIGQIAEISLPIKKRELYKWFLDPLNKLFS